MVLLYGRAGRLTAENGGFRPGQYATGAAPALALSWRRHAPSCAAECASNACSGVRDSAVKCRGCDVHNADPFVEVDCTSEGCTSGASEASEHGCFPGIPTYGGGCGHCLSGEGECIDYFGHHCAPVDAATAACPQVRKMPSWPRSWANFSLL